MPTVPLLRDILPGPERRPPISLALLAKELNVPVSRLLPLIEQGYLRAVDSQTVESPLPAGLLWVRGWFQPVQAKPLFSEQDIADLLGVPKGSVAGLAAAHDAPVTFDGALGLTFTTWSARRLILEVLGTGRRFDRSAILHFLLDGKNPVPPFSEQVEAEIQRIAELPEPTRSIRRENLLTQWRDAVTVSGAEPPAQIEHLMRTL